MSNVIIKEPRTIIGECVYIYEIESTDHSNILYETFLLHKDTYCQGCNNIIKIGGMCGLLTINGNIARLNDGLSNAQGWCIYCLQDIIHEYVQNGIHKYKLASRKHKLNLIN